MLGIRFVYQTCCMCDSTVTISDTVRHRGASPPDRSTRSRPMLPLKLAREGLDSRLNRFTPVGAYRGDQLRQTSLLRGCDGQLILPVLAAGLQEALR